MQELGVAEYLRITFLLLVVADVLMLFMYWVLIVRFGREDYRLQYAVGYSG